ncbi:MAG: BACON domain-containing protein [Bacteroidaceae bacterium]|nr:BACON domain-containing protein [Bacteroidaceae bacterium]
MAILSWGKCSLRTIPSVGGAPSSSGSWTALDTPKEDTTKLVPTAGTEKTATEEGGGIVDFKVAKTTYQLEFNLFVKKGYSRPFDDNDGVIDGEHAFRVIPEDNSCEGIQIDRAVVRCEESFSTADGIMLHYVCKCLIPAEGKTVKPYTEGGLALDKYELFFSGAADTTGKTVSATSTGNVSASSNQSWCTVTTAAKVTTVKVSANSDSSQRVAYVTITADGKSAIVKVTQIPQ